MSSNAKNLVNNQGNLTHFVCRQVRFFRIQSTLCNALLPDLDESPGYVDTELTLIDTKCKCLSFADKISDVSTVTIAPIAKQSVGMDQWTLSHTTAKAIYKLDEQRHGNEGQLKVVQFVNLCITDADVLSVVLKQLLL
jgi:hypothetical protein